MQNEYDTSGRVIREARKAAKLTREELSDIIKVSERYIASIENEGKKPSYNVLYKLIQTLAIDANSIFYPNKGRDFNEKDKLIRMIDLCDERSLKIISAALQTALEQ